MGETEQMISLYHTGFMICLVLTILFIALSVFLFFKLKIRNVFNILTGRAEKRSIRMMEEENAKTGKLRRDYTPTHTSSDLYTTPSGGVPPVVYTPTDDQGADKTSERRPSHLVSSVSQTVQPANHEEEGSEPTTLLHEGEGSEATTLLHEGEGSEATTLLHETDIPAEDLSEGTPGETMLLTPQMEAEMNAAEENKRKIPGRFQITKDQIWIHTDEMI